MAEQKTKETSASVADFLDRIADAKRRAECKTVLEMMREATKMKPKMWGDAIVGFGSYHYKYESGREGDWFLMGFSPRKQNLTLYFMTGLERSAELRKSLGKHTTGSSCLYIKKLEDIDLDVLRRVIADAAKQKPLGAAS